ncbi:Conserved oligomeric Golgi complex subunit [Bulinus truncatus]|nr:Conserved oligomeric Golgi complex subunit [Bulinus truncatus]
MAGKYICEAQGMGSSMLPKVLVSLAIVPSIDFSFNSMSQQIRIGKLENLMRIEENNRLTEKIKALQVNLTEKITVHENMDPVVWKQWEEDDVFRHFLDENFDVKAHANKAIQGLVISEQLGKLAEGISLLDKEIHGQIVTHYEDLLSQATGVETLEGVLLMMQTRIQSLLGAMDRIRAKICEPYSKILARTVQLRNLQETCDLLRRIIRIMYLSKRLHSQLEGGAREITKAAQSLNELDYICQGVDLGGVEIIEQDRRFVKQARKEVETQAQKMLEQGMGTQNQTAVATSLQVFYNLGSLCTVVERVVAGCRATLHQQVRACLDVQALTMAHGGSGKAPGRAAMPAPGNTAALRANMWTNMEKLMDNIYSACVQVQHLQKVLVKKRDPVSHVCFIDELAKHKDNNVNIIHSFWEDVTHMLTLELNNASENSTFLKQSFEGEYPKLLRLYSDLWRRLQQFSIALSVTPSTGPVDIVSGVDTDEDFFSQTEKSRQQYDSEKVLRETLTAFENAYLTRSLSRLFDSINLVFTSSSSNPPTSEEVDNIVKTITSELNVSSGDNKLNITVAKNVAKTVKLFCVKSEQLLSTDGEASQVIGPPSTGQIRNVGVVNTLFQFHQAVSKMLSGITHFPDEAQQSINSSLEYIVQLMGTAIQPLLSSISDALEAIILTIHGEDFSGPAPSKSETEAPCSLYMKELHSFIARCQSDYLSPFKCKDFIIDSINPLACRCIDLFVRHASLVRPLGDGGKLRLAADFAQMEMAISPLCRRPADLGKSYRLLRAFRPLLFQTPEHVAQSPALGEIIPYSTVIQFLFARGPPELKSPHQVSDWSVIRYSQWLDDHPTESDRLKIIKGALEAYAKLIRQKQGKEYTAVYPIMLELLQKGLQ